MTEGRHTKMSMTEPPEDAGDRDAQSRLEEELDRPRGILTTADREYLTYPEGSLDLTEQTARKRRSRIRERVYNAILDFDYLAKLPDDERRPVFEKVRDGWVNGTSSVALRRLFKFVYLGLKSVGLERGFGSVLERAIEDAEKEFARGHGDHVEVNVTFDVEVESRTTSEELEERYESGEKLSLEEQGVLADEKEYGMFDEMMMDSPYFDPDRENPGEAAFEAMMRDSAENVRAQDAPEEEIPEFDEDMDLPEHQRRVSPLIEGSMMATPIPQSIPMNFDQLYEDLSKVLVWALRDDIHKTDIGFEEFHDVQELMPNPVIIQTYYQNAGDEFAIDEDDQLKEFVTLWDAILAAAGWERPEGFDGLLEAMDFDPDEYDSERLDVLLTELEGGR